MYLFQTARVELYHQIAKYKNYITGKVLDVGASASTARYRDLFVCEEYLTLDTESVVGVDIVGTAESIPVPDASFDSIVCTQVLGDVYELPRAFAEFYRVLKRGGVALITESFMDPLHDEPKDFWRFTAHSLRRLAEDIGFTVEILEPRGGYHSVMMQMRTRYAIERFHLYHAWYGILAQKSFALFGRYAMLRDRMDTSKASRLFTHGYLLIIRKHA